MHNYEILNYDTGEYEQVETSIDIKLINDFNEWRINSKLNPPKYSPDEFVQYLENTRNKEKIAKAVEILEKYSVLEYPVPVDIIRDVHDILANKGSS